MTINRKELIKLLVDKTDMSQAEVEAQLDELTNRIVDAAKRGKALEIKGLGLFYFDEVGELCFKASDQFDTEINFQYAGMEPVELKPSKQTPATAAANKEKDKEKEKDKDPLEKSEAETAGKDQEKTESELEDDDDVFGIGKTLSGKAGDQDQMEVKADDSDDEEQKESDPFKNLFQNPADDLKSQEEETSRKAGTTTGKKSPKTDQPKRAATKQSRNPMSLIIYIFIGLAVLTVGYLIISDYLEAPEPATPVTEQAIPVEEPPSEAEPDITDTEEPVDQDEVIDRDVPAEEEPVAAPVEERYGLHGNYIEASGIDFTIVVHSWQTREQADRIADELRQEGYRIIVTEGTVDERIVFRVGIGQFESVQSALSEAELLPEPYRNQNFIHRIQ